MSLTWDQKKTVKTIPGGICSIITGIFLAYYIITNGLDIFLDAKYAISSESTVIFGDGQDPMRYDISTSDLQIFSRIASKNPTIQANLDAYVSGVFLQEHYDNAT